MCNRESNLLPINNIPFLSLPIAIDNVSSLEVTFTVPRLCIDLRIVEVSLNHRRPSYAKFAPDVVVGYIVTVVVDQSKNLVISPWMFEGGVVLSSLDVCIRHESITNASSIILIRIIKQ